MQYLQQLYGKLFGDGSYNANTQRKLIAFGNVLLDRTARLPNTELLDRFNLPPDDRVELDVETLSKLTAEACEGLNCPAHPGGSALNTVRILKHLGTEAIFFGAVGEDKHAEELRDALKEHGVEARLQTISEAPTGRCICVVHDDKVALFANIGASAQFSIDHLKEAERDECQAFLRPIERKQIIYIEGFFVPHREHVCEFIVKNYIRERRRLALNLSSPYIVRQNYETMLQLAENALFLFGNQSEFQAFAEQMGHDSVEDMAKVLLQRNSDPKVIVITRGAQGVQVISNYVDEYQQPGEITFQSYNAPRVPNVVDTTGAGDAFVGGFLHSWLEKRSLSECVRVATDISAQVVTQIGCNLPDDNTS